MFSCQFLFIFTTYGLLNVVSKVTAASHLKEEDYYNVIPPSDDSIDGCIYTFYVPYTKTNLCPPGSSENDYSSKLERITSSVSKERLELTEKLDYLSRIIQNLTTSHQSFGGGENGKEDPKLKSTNIEVGSKVGTHYTRWGSVSCPDTAELLYTGFAAKSHNAQGGGANFLCLPKDPEFPENAESGFQSQSYIYGVEYEKQTSPLIPSEKTNNDVPCAVCHITGRGEQIMIPAKKTCPSGWTQEYDGILMAQHHRQQSSDFICVDKEMEVLIGGSPNAEGGLLYVVEAFCGSLICPPYVNGYELLCTVCTL